MPQGDPAALARAAATYTAAHGEIDRGRAALVEATGQASGTAWTGVGAAAYITAGERLTAAYTVTAAALARGAVTLRIFATDLAAAQQAARRANAAVATANATAASFRTAHADYQQSATAADRASDDAVMAHAQAAGSPHSPAARLAADNAQSAADDAQSAASAAAGRMSALSAQADADRARAIALCAQAELESSQATSKAAAGFNAASGELIGKSARPVHGVADGPPAPAHKEGFWSHVGSFLGDAAHEAENIGADSVNALASFSNAALHDPGGVFAMMGGISLATLGAGGDAAGFVLDATGIGAVAGVPLNAISTAAVVAGSATAAGGAASLIDAALGPDRVTIMQARGNDRGGGDSPHSKEEVSNQAKQLGYGQRVSTKKLPFNSHGQPGFWNGKVYISPDADGHNTWGWKMFSRDGDRLGTFNWDLTERVKG